MSCERLRRSYPGGTWPSPSGGSSLQLKPAQPSHLRCPHPPTHTPTAITALRSATLQGALATFQVELMPGVSVSLGQDQQ